jgi:hypothetical protein
MSTEMQMRALWTAVILLFGGMLFFGLRYYGVSFARSESDEAYYAVYLESGDVYFGHLSYFPRLTLRDVHFLSGDGERITMSNFKDAAWGPEDRLYLNYEKVLWIAKVRSDSSMLDLFRGIVPSVVPSTFNPGVTDPTPAPASTYEISAWGSWSEEQGQGLV